MVVFLSLLLSWPILWPSLHSTIHPKIYIYIPGKTAPIMPKNQSMRLCARGTSAQNPTIVHIIDTTLYMRSVVIQTKRQKWTYKGCSDLMPYFDASRPVMKGKAAEPDIPMPVIQATLPVRSHAGRMRVACEMRMGNMGPRRTPMNATASAFSMMDGTNHTVI